jgi:arylformamidase
VDRIEPAHLEAIPPGTTRLLFQTRDSQRWDGPLAPFATDYVALSPAAARWVVERGIELVGIDYLSIAPYDDPDDVVHRTLLGAGVLVVEGLDLRRVPPGAYTMICLPLRLLAGDGAPARVLLIAEGDR